MAEAEKKLSIDDKYKLTFQGPIAREVLADILKIAHYGVTLDPDDPEQIGGYNLAVEILGKCGFLTVENMLGLRNLPQ